MIPCTLFDLAGQRFAQTVFASFADRWTWVAECVASKFECDASDVHSLETDDGDEFIAINDKAVAYMVGPGHSAPAQATCAAMQQAA